MYDLCDDKLSKMFIMLHQINPSKIIDVNK